MAIIDEVKDIYEKVDSTETNAPDPDSHMILDYVKAINDSLDGSGGDEDKPGFGTPTATATQLESGAEPTVSVTAEGPDTAKVFNFSFGIPKGDKGDTGEQGLQGPSGPVGAQGPAGADGVTPAISASATVDSTTGTPVVQVTKGGTDEAPSFQFSFTGLKGETGPQGPTGTVTVSKPDYYYLTASSSGTQTYTIPDYAATNIVEVYLNGFRLEPINEYTLTDAGVITTVNSVNENGRLMIVVWRF